MSLSSLSSAQLKQLVLLVKYKEMLETKLAKVKSEIEALGAGSEPIKAGVNKRGPRRGRRRAKLKDVILKALREAGKAGLSVKELAANSKANLGSVSVWFYTTGKKIKGLKKIGPARYSYLG